MSLQDLGSIGEFIAAIATLVTLVYLALQIRQNTRAVRTTTYQSVLESSNDFQKMTAEPELGRIYRAGRRDPSALSEDETTQFRALMGHLLNIYETLYLQHERGVLDDDFWQARCSILRILLSQPGIRDYAAVQCSTYARSGRVPGFMALLDDLLEMPPVARDTDVPGR